MYHFSAWFEFSPYGSSLSEVFLKICVSVKLTTFLKNTCDRVQTCSLQHFSKYTSQVFSKDFARIFSYFSLYFGNLGTATFKEHLCGCFLRY